MTWKPLPLSWGLPCADATVSSSHPDTSKNNKIHSFIIFGGIKREYNGYFFEIQGNNRYIHYKWRIEAGNSSGRLPETPGIALNMSDIRDTDYSAYPSFIYILLPVASSSRSGQWPNLVTKSFLMASSYP